MAEVLLTSESFVKSVTSISENVFGNYLLPSIREAQETSLRGVLGDLLTDRLKEVVSSSETPEKKYLDLIDKLQYFLAYSTIVKLIPKVQFKIGNAGVIKTTDENIQTATFSEIEKMIFNYQNQADVECRKLQQWLLKNYSDYPELSENDCRSIKANLTSAASCGLWLGGARGKRRLV
jgi:hypothetical protein